MVKRFARKFMGQVTEEFKYTAFRFFTKSVKEEIIESVRDLIQHAIFTLFVKGVQKYVFEPCIRYINDCAERRGEDPKYSFTERCVITE